jgi:hypothetical protein
MERRYLAATIAMAATFALFSHAFGSGLLTRVHDPRPVLISEMHCAAQTLRTRLLDKVNRSFGPGSAEEAQLRVELNLPAAAALAAVPAVPAPPAVAPVAPAPPVKMSARQIVACPSQRLVAVQVSKDYERAQARAMAMQSKALANQARVMAVQARLTSETMQREITRAALAQARANMTQVKVSSHPCNGGKSVRVSSRSGDDGTDIDVDLDQISRQVEEQVSRSLRNNVRNF